LVNIQTALSQPGGFDKLLTGSKVGVEKAIQNHITEQNLGGTSRLLSTPEYGSGAATVVPGSTAAVTKSPNAPLFYLGLLELFSDPE